MEFIPCCAQMNAAPNELRPLPAPPPPLLVPGDLITSKADLAAALKREPRTLRVSRLRVVFGEFIQNKVPGLKPGQGSGRTWQGNPNVAEYDLEAGESR